MKTIMILLALVTVATAQPADYQAALGTITALQAQRNRALDDLAGMEAQRNAAQEELKRLKSGSGGSSSGVILNSMPGTVNICPCNLNNFSSNCCTPGR